MISAKLPQSLTLLLYTLLVCSIPQLGAAQTASKEPLDTELLKPDAPRKGRDIVTANTLSQTAVSVPSLWWAKEQLDQVNGKLLNNWIAYQDEKRLDLVVNRQSWTLLNYIDKYYFINKFGVIARTHNYNVRVFNQQGEALATYTCNYSQSPALCAIVILDSFGRTSLPVKRPSLEGE